MAQISALNIGGTEYEIYAVSATTAVNAESATNAANATKADAATVAGSAGKLTAAKTLTVTGHVTGSVSTDWGSDKTLGLTITANPWSAMGNVSASAVNTNTTGFVTPKEIVDYVATTTAAAIGSAYRHQGTCDVTALSGKTPVVGDVWNVTGCAAGGTDVNGQLVFNGDNLVATATAKANTSWDKLAATFDASNYITTATWNTSTANWQKAYTAVTANSASNWDNGKISAFKTINAGGTNVVAASNAATVTITGANGIKVAGAGTTVTISPSAYAYGSVTVNGVATSASKMGDVIGFSAGSNMSITTAANANGNPVINLSAKDSNTTYSQATTSKLGTNYAAYVTGSTAVLF